MPITDLLNETVTRHTQTTDARHDSSDDGSTTLSARIERKPRLVRTQDGEEVLSTHQVWINGDQTVDMTDEWEVDGARLQVIRVNKAFDRDSIHHTKLWLR